MLHPALLSTAPGAGFQQLTDSEQASYLRAVLDASLNGIVGLNAIRNQTGQIIDFWITLVNPASVRMTNTPAQTSVGNKLLTVFPDNVGTGFFDAYCRVADTGEPAQMTQHYNDGRLEAWFEISAVQSGPDAVVVTFMDVTQRKRQEARLKRSNEDLERFAFVASHDLQEPLRKIQAFGDLLRTMHADALPEAGLNLLTRMQGATSRMQVLIRDLLVFSRLSNQPTARVPVSLQKIVADVLIDLDLTIAEKNAHIQVGTLPTLPGDALQLRQLVQNLLTNALKFSRAGVPPVVNVAARPATTSDKPKERSGSFIVLIISDNGIGFDPQHADKIFQVFQRLHSREQFSGTGIGLSICQKVAENHGGQITAHSQPGAGATFEVLLPVG